MTDTYKHEPTSEEREFELRAHIGAYWSGGRLFIGMYTFLSRLTGLLVLLPEVEQQR